MVNNNWCVFRNVVSLSHLCSPNLELLTIKCCLFYLLCEFTSVNFRAAYIPHQANTDIALS